jgi:hypothetical protein
MEWGIYPAADGTKHVVPRHAGIHYWPECWCNPAIGDDRVVIHNAIERAAQLFPTQRKEGNANKKPARGARPWPVSVSLAVPGL